MKSSRQHQPLKGKDDSLELAIYNPLHRAPENHLLKPARHRSVTSIPSFMDYTACSKWVMGLQTYIAQTSAHLLNDSLVSILVQLLQLLLVIHIPWLNHIVRHSYIWLWIMQ